MLYIICVVNSFCAKKWMACGLLSTQWQARAHGEFVVRLQ